MQKQRARVHGIGTAAFLETYSDITVEFYYDNALAELTARDFGIETNGPVVTSDGDIMLNAARCGAG